MKTIKRLVAFALVAIFCAGTAHADFRWGIKAGMNFSKINYKNLQENIDPSNRAGWEAGLMAEFTIPIVNIGADASVMYSRMNLNEEYGTVRDENGNTTQTLLYDRKNFLDIPINLKWKIGLPVVSNIVKPMIFTGPDFLFAFGKDTLKDIESKSCEVGWNVGLGIELLNHLQLQGAYCIGINKIADGAFGINATDQYKAKKNYWTVTAAYLF